MAQEQSSPHEDPNRVVHGNDVQPSCVWVKQQEGAQTDELTTKFLKNGKIDDYDINGVPYEHVDILGRGNSGLVEKVQHKSTKQIYARKLLVIPRKRQAEQESIFLNEVAVIRRLCDHHHFIKVMAAYKTEKNFGIILFPVAENGDLSEFLEHYRGLQEDLQRLEVADPKLKTAEMELKTMTVVLERAFGCLASGLAFMHEQRIRHKDIKPQNVLVHAGTVLFTDFGYSLDSSRFSHSATDGRPDFLTRRYCAKEVLEHERRDSSSDVWSLGCVLIEVLCALTCAIEIDEARIFSEAMPDIHADLVSTSISDEYLPLVDNLVDMTSLEASMRPTSKVVRESLLIHHTFNCQECLAGASGTRTIDTEYLSNGVKNPSSTDDARKPGAFDYEIPKSASASDSLLAEGDETRLGVNQDALNMLNQVPRDPSIIGGQLVLMQTMPTDSSYELRSSTDAASQPQGLGLQQENSRNISIRRTMANDGTRTILNDDGSDTSDRDPDTCTDHLSDIALPIPRSTELETGTEAGTWDEISERTKTLGGYDQGANKHLHSSIRSSLEKSLHKDTNDSYDGATREDPIAEHSKSPQQPSIAGRATNPQPIEWSEAYQRYFQRKYNHTTQAWDIIDWNVTTWDRQDSVLLKQGSSCSTEIGAPVWPTGQRKYAPNTAPGYHGYSYAESSTAQQGAYSVYPYVAIPNTRHTAVTNLQPTSNDYLTQIQSGAERRLPRGRGQSIVGEYVKGRNLHYETLDSSYLVRHAKFFTEGKIIAVIWNETASAITKPIDYNTSRSLSVVKYEGNMVYTSVRRFVVVKRKRDSCYACPIFTYGQHGCTKNGVIASEHAIVYPWNDTPKMVQGETGFTKPHIPVIMADGVPNLHFSSRIYYGIHHPIQHNVKVKDIGHVPATDIHTLIGSWQEENQGTNQAAEDTASAD